MKTFLTLCGLFVLYMSLSACQGAMFQNVTTRVIPEDKTVAATLKGSDCVVNWFGLIYIGTVSVEQAMRNARTDRGTGWYGDRRSIIKVRRTETTSYSFWPLPIAWSCVEVVGSK